MLMQGFPLHRLQLSGLSDQDTRLFVYDDSSRCYGCQEIGDLAGNSMALPLCRSFLDHCSEGAGKHWPVFKETSFIKYSQACNLDAVNKFCSNL